MPESLFQQSCRPLQQILQKRLWYRYFPVNFAKFLKTPFLQNTFGRLLPEKLLFQNCFALD